jgi:recombinational DNA repair protein (RecF pathway)
VLHSWDWSETSLIVELFTRERGRVVVVAKGAKRPYSQLRPVLLPFQRLQVQLGRPPADERRGAPAALGRAGRRPADAGRRALFAGFYLNELLLKLLARQDPHRRCSTPMPTPCRRCRAPTRQACSDAALLRAAAAARARRAARTASSR